ncbi:MAG: HAD family hydrolase [bacterium]
MTNNPNVKAVLFDLDGTLLDTAGDLIGAVNVLLDRHGKKPLPVADLRPWVSQGGLSLVSRAFDLPPDGRHAHKLWRDYLKEYKARLSTTTSLFDGMATVLNSVESTNRKWGIVTNKPEFLTSPLLKQLNLEFKPDCVVCGDTVSRSKPWPDPVLHACDLLKISPSQGVMVGDDERDILSGQSAGMVSLAASWGYIRPNDDPEHWGADAILEHPTELQDWI